MGTFRIIAVIALIAIRARAADAEAAIRDTFVKPWVEALRSKDPARVKRFFHPAVLACMNERNREFFDLALSRESRTEAAGAYKITQLTPVMGAASLFGLPADALSYPVQPTYEITVQFDPGNKILVRYLAPANGSWFEVSPCPSEKGMAMMHDQRAKGDEQRKHATQLAAAVKDPLLSELKALLSQHNLVEAAKKYQQATGEDLTNSVMVVKILDAEHPVGKP